MNIGYVFRRLLDMNCPGLEVAEVEVGGDSKEIYRGK